MTRCALAGFSASRCVPVSFTASRTDSGLSNSTNAKFFTFPFPSIDRRTDLTVPHGPNFWRKRASILAGTAQRSTQPRQALYEHGRWVWPAEALGLEVDSVTFSFGLALLTLMTRPQKLVKCSPSIAASAALGSLNSVRIAFGLAVLPANVAYFCDITKRRKQASKFVV